MSQRNTSVVIGENGKGITLFKDDYYRKQELLRIPRPRGKRLTYSTSQSSRGYTTSTTDTFSSESSTICQYYDNESSGRNWRLNSKRSCAPASYGSTPPRENCYRWLIPQRIYLPRAPSSTGYTIPLVERSRRMDYACKPNAQNDRIISVQPRFHYPQSIPIVQARPYWQGMTKAELQKYLQKRRSLRFPSTENKSRASKSRPSISSFDSYKSRIFRSCPSCFGADESGGSDYSSSDESGGGSDTENEDCERGNDDGIFGDGDNSNISDQDESSGGSDSNDSDDSLNADYSINSSMYDEDIMINEERAFAEVGVLDSDEEFDLEDADGHGNLSSDSFTDSDEFLRDDDGDRGIHFQDTNGEFDQEANFYDSDGIL